MQFARKTPEGHGHKPFSFSCNIDQTVKVCLEGTSSRLLNYFYHFVAVWKPWLTVFSRLVTRQPVPRKSEATVSVTK